MAIHLPTVDSKLSTDDYEAQRSKTYNGKLRKLISLVTTILFGSLIVTNYISFSNVNKNEIEDFSAISKGCPKIEPLIPTFKKSIGIILNDPLYKASSIERLSGAVQISTEVQDVNPDPLKDPEFYSNFVILHTFLEKTFPLVHSKLTLEKINQFGLLYTWEGETSDLKPILMMSHQDVVPVNKETWDSWKYPPFSGHYEPETDLIWGRGSNDCKNLMIAQLEALEKLLEDGFIPKRTILLSIGFDEEASGIWGARFLSPHIHERYGDDGVLIILDEGAGILEVDDNVYVATPVNGEKGYVDVEINISGHGGHSSIPPPHTTIGIAAELITLLENNPFASEFRVDNPIYGVLTCAAEHSTKLPKSVRKSIINAPYCKKAREYVNEFLSKQPTLRDLVRSTLAVDIIHGGVKANALPEDTKFLVNHRVILHSSVKETVQKDIEYALEIADKYDYGVSVDGVVLKKTTKNGSINLRTINPLEPAPISPNEGPVWDLLAGTIQDVFENNVFKNTAEENKEIYVTTGLFSGNTDTKYYWNLTKNIYRFVGSIMDPTIMETVHSVNEHIDMEGHLSAIAFVYEFIVNVSEHGSDLD
ncbi:similar to Saccharomyces cerevisiae YJL172W CPS1 Vacuolar carboxypeptidase yscS [Maudiozyma saulgeensis]|uniref:Similar to Saccharomyces cerevisiae YJL172W CPS1 Vacuolar carboxypeptidase yscS n=1 Tax=Maudiozyma saulgeensis TaxID=1789683 RepID=A0A1X7R151_9SACH|nr:similar to Saccharomyces cerevisiae YJL172W CPS1 Vacuolar carboxypeptidase yscS [Kazachstania saulgeensis]